MIEISEVEFAYKNNPPIFGNLNLSIKKGNIFGISGAIGSGKSTLALLMAGALVPGKGNIMIDDVNIRKYNIRELRKKICVVMQNANRQLFEPTVYDELAFGLRNIGADENKIHRRINKYISDMGFGGDVLGKPPLYLSGGEIRRIAIASVIIMKPECLILDEPISDLDDAGREMIESIIAQYRNDNKTLIVISHDRQFLEKHCEGAFSL